jgi:hypothetical protein
VKGEEILPIEAQAPSEASNVEVFLELTAQCGLEGVKAWPHYQVVTCHLGVLGPLLDFSPEGCVLCSMQM